MLTNYSLEFQVEKHVTEFYLILVYLILEKQCY